METLLDQGLLWRTRDRRKARERPHWPTGFSRLDAILPDHGWPVGEMVELLVERLYQGGILLLLPLLGQVSKKQYIAWVNPPNIPYPVALRQWGVNLSRVLWIRTPDEESAWAVEQLAASGHLGSLLFWPGTLTYPHSRRLQLAASSGSCCVFILRTLRHRDTSSGAALRLTLRPSSSDQATRPGLNIEIVKGRSSVHRHTYLQLDAYSPRS